MANIPWSAFPNVGAALNTDTLVGLRSGNNVRMSPNSLQPINKTGVGNPNLSQSGTAGVNFYFDTSTFELWKCIISGAPAGWELITSKSNISPVNIIYFSNSKGNDTTGNGSEFYPYQTYDAAVNSVASIATINNQYGVCPLGSNEPIPSDLILYPFVNLVGSNSSVNSINVSGQVVLSSSWATTVSPQFSCTDVSTIVPAVNINFPPVDNCSVVFNNSPFINTTDVTVTGSGTDTLQLFILLNCVNLAATPNFTFVDVVGVLDNSSASNIKMNGVSSTKQGILVLLNNPILISGDVYIISSVVAQGAAGFFGNSRMGSSLIIDGSNSVALIDAISYTPSISFSNGATFNNIQLLTTSDGVDCSTYTPVNFSLPPSPSLYPEKSATNYIAGIDNALLTPGTPGPLVSVNRNTFPALHLPAFTNTTLLFPNTYIDTNFLYNVSTGTVTIAQAGYYYIEFNMSSSAMGNISNFTYTLNAWFFVNGLQRDDTSIYINQQTLNTFTCAVPCSMSTFIFLYIGDTLVVNVANSGNLDVSIPYANLNLEFIRS